MITEKTILALEFDKIRAILSKHAVSASGKKLLTQLLPADCIEQSNILLNETYEADRILYEYAESPDFSFDDITEILEMADKNVMLSMGDLLKVARVMKISRNVSECINKIPSGEAPLIKEYANELYSDHMLEDEIYKNILSENDVADSASSDLKRIRSTITRCNINIKHKLTIYTTSSAYVKYLQDAIVTMRNNRYVIPVRSEYKNNIPGLIHDQSASGATVFIEPFQIVQLNNEIASLKISESYEIEKILKTFTIRVGSEATQITKNFDVLTSLDVIFAKAIYAHKIKAERPELNIKGYIDIINGKHPLIDPTKVVPVSIKIEEGKKVLMITGPNTGGKTVTLKIVGLFCMMSMCGIYPPCEFGSKIAYFNSIFCDIGDEQSIENSLSTFSSHMVNIIGITENCDSSSLVLLDELGAGTDPIEGASIAVATTEEFISRGATSIITTHYQQMKEFSLTNPIIATASMDFDPNTFEPTYKLLLGCTGSSNAIDIASRLGLSIDIINKARSLLSDDKIQFDAIVLSAERARRDAETSLAEVQLMRIDVLRELNVAKMDREHIANERAKLNVTMRKEATKILEEYLDEADEAIEKIKEITNAPTESGLFEARTLKNKLNNINYIDESNEKIIEFDISPIKVGDMVYVKSLDKNAQVIADDTRKCEYMIKMGLISTNVKYSRVNKIVSKTSPKKKEKATVVMNRPISNETILIECNVLGKRVDEAITIVDKYLDSAMLAGLKEVRIVHGKGTGALRTALQAHFKKHPRVLTYRLGRHGEGEWGVTIIEIK